MTSKMLTKLASYLAHFKKAYFYKSPMFLFLELILVIYENKFWCSERLLDRNNGQQWYIFWANQQLVEGWFVLKTQGILIEGRHYILDLSNRNDLFRFFQVITGNEHDPETLNMMHKRLHHLFRIFRQIERDLGPELLLVDWESAPASHTRFVEPYSDRMGIAWNEFDLREPAGDDFVATEVYEIGDIEDRNLTDVRDWYSYELNFWDHWLPKERKWREEEPFFKELKANPEFHKENPCPEDVEPLEPDWKASEEITTLSSPNSLNNRNLCESFNGFEEVSSNGFCNSTLHKFIWLFEETSQSFDFFFSGLFWFIKIFLIMKRNSMLIFTKIKIKHFFLYCKKKFK